MSNLLSVVDVILSALEITDKIVRGSLSVSFWVLGRILGALTSRTANRIYAAIIGAIIYACQSAIESGQIVREGYHSVDVVEVVPSESTQRLLCGSKPQHLLCGSKTPLLLAPSIDSEIEFIDDLLKVGDSTRVPDFDSVSIAALRSLGSLHQIKGASRWTKKQAIEVLSAA